ncbi:MAG TPA: hypothetical protein VI636_03335 [Candidatus Angelobacter sp.]
MLKPSLKRALTVTILLFGVAKISPQAQQQEEAPAKPASPGIVYRNPQYGFCFSLPMSWQGYSIVMDQWDGFSMKGQQGHQGGIHGPIISIRHPLWTKENPRQDIPIMVFTRRQWDSLLKDEFHIGAAPIGPSELGRNHKHVFALPARYNFGYLTGFEEVDQIVRSSALQTPCKEK